MRFSAYVVALFFFEVQSQQQCSESLGTCSGSRASLMQVKSFSQKLQTSTGRGTSKHAETLAGFQKYTSELVDKYLAADPQQSGLGDEVISAINIIKDYLQSLYEDLLTFHNQDVKASEWCAGAAQRCVDRDLPVDMANKLDSYNIDVTRLQEDYTTCQKALSEECDPTTTPPPVCPTYHEHRREDDATFPLCGKEGHLREEYREAEFAVSGPNTMLNHFEHCLGKMQPWLDPLYTEYSTCEGSESSSTTEPTGCDAKQHLFEEEYCLRLTYRDTHCDAFDTCMTHANDHCENGVTKDSPGVCPQIEANWKARQTDNETAERISCLLDVLTSADSDKGAGLQACHERDFSQVNEFWVIDCLITGAQPAAGMCTRDKDSCGDNFVGLYSITVRQDGEATCCENGEGHCRDACEFQCSSAAPLEPAPR